MKKTKGLAFLMVLLLTACNQGVSGEGTKASEAGDGTAAEPVFKETEGVTGEEFSTEEEASVEKIDVPSDERMTELCWVTMVSNAIHVMYEQLDATVPVELYLSSIHEPWSPMANKTASAYYYVGKESSYADIVLWEYEDGSLYGAPVVAAGGTDIGMYPADHEEPSPPYWLDEVRAADNLFSITGTATTEISDSFKQNMEAIGADKYDISGLLSICMHYISEEYFRLNGDIEGELTAQLHLTEIDFSLLSNDPGSGRAAGSAKGWLKMGSEEAVSVETSFNLVDWCDWGDQYEMVSGEMIEGDLPESLLSVACELKTETKGN